MAGPDILSIYPEVSVRSRRQENSSHEGAGDSVESIRVARDEAGRWQEASNGLPPEDVGDDVRKARSLVAVAQSKALGVEAEMSQVMSAGTARLRGTLSDYRRLDPNYVFVRPKPPVDVGVMWWGETDWWTPADRIGLYAYFDDAAGGVRFVGQIDYDDGDLWKGSVGARAIFGLGTNRMPPAGRYVSRPTSDLFGEVLGFTGLTTFGDNWSKCWMHTDQTLRNASGAIVANAHAAQTLIFYEDDGSWGVTPLPGSLFFPEVAFDLDPTQPLTATLELKFDLQLEGVSLFRFGNFGGFVAALFRTPQWTLAKA